MNRRSFIKLAMAAPAIKVIDFIAPDKKPQEMPKALIVDPYMVNMKDLSDIAGIGPGKIRLVRVRRPFWGAGEPIRKLF